MNDVALPQASDRVGILDRLWRTLAGPRLTLILLVWVAAVLALSAVIPQAPPNLEDPLVRSQWLATVPIRALPAFESLQALGVFGLRDSAWLRLPLALMLAHCLVMLAALCPALNSRVRGIAGQVDPLGKEFQVERRLPAAAGQAGRQVLSRLEQAGYRVLSLEEGEAPEPDRQRHIAWRWRWSWLGLAGIYLGLGLACAGLILEGWLGQGQDIILAPDTPIRLAWLGEAQLVLEETTVTGNDPLRPSSGVASLSLSNGLGERRPLSLRQHSSQLWQGMWLTLTGLQPVAEVSAVDADTEEPVLLQAFSPRAPPQERVRLALVGDPELRLVGVPAQNVTLRVDYNLEASRLIANGEVAEPTLTLYFFQGAEASPRRSAPSPSGGEVMFDGVRYRAALDHNVGLRIESSPWWMLVAVAVGITALSFILLTVMPPVYVQTIVERADGGSQVTLTADLVGDEQRIQRDLRAFITPDE